MKTTPFSIAGISFLELLLAICLLFLSQCHSSSNEVTANTEFVQTDTTNLPTFLHDNASIINGSVTIRLESHGSIRAEVFRDQVAQYEFILDREKLQNFIRKSIDRANVYIIPRGNLVVDDLTTHKRYILAAAISSNYQEIAHLQHSKNKTILIKGYGTSFTSGGFTGLE